MRGLEQIGLDIVHALRERAQLVRSLEECTARLDAMNAEAQSFYDRPVPVDLPTWPHENVVPLNVVPTGESAERTAVMRPQWLDRGVPALSRACAFCPDPQNWDERAHPNGQHGHVALSHEQWRDGVQSAELRNRG